jgi:hypothetical protein
MIDHSTSHMIFHDDYIFRKEDHLIDGETPRERYLRMAGIKKYSPFKLSDSTSTSDNTRLRYNNTTSDNRS